MDQTSIKDIVDFAICPLEDNSFIKSCRTSIDENGVWTLPNFLNAKVIKYLVDEASAAQHLAFLYY